MGETDCGENWVLFWWGGAMLSKSLIRFSADVWGCVPSLLFDLRPKYGGGNGDNGASFKRSQVRTATLSAPNPAAPPPTYACAGGSLTLTGTSGSVSCGVTAPFCFVCSILLQNLHRTGKTDSWRAQTKPCAHQDPGEKSRDPTRDWPRHDIIYIYIYTHI